MSRARMSKHSWQVQAQREVNFRQKVLGEGSGPFVEGFAVIEVDWVGFQVGNHDSALTGAREALDDASNVVDVSSALG